MARARTAPAAEAGETREGIEVPADGTEVELVVDPENQTVKAHRKGMVEMTWNPTSGLEEYHGANGVNLYPGKWELVPTDEAEYLLAEFPRNAKAK